MPAAIVKECEQCNEPFEARRPRRFCTDACRSAAAADAATRRADECLADGSKNVFEVMADLYRREWGRAKRSEKRARRLEMDGLVIRQEILREDRMKVMEPESVQLHPAECIRDKVREFESLDTESLRDIFRKAIEITIEQVKVMAAVIFVLDARGEMPAEIGAGSNYLRYLRKVASNQLLPEALVGLRECADVLDRVADLPLVEQKRITSGEPITVVTLSPSGQIHRMESDAASLSPRAMSTVFAKDHIRSEEEQIQLLRVRAQRSEPTAMRASGIHDVEIDRAKKVVRVTRARDFTLAELGELIQLLTGKRR